MIWSLESGKVTRTINHEEMRSVIVSPDAGTIAVLGKERWISLWNADTGKKTREIPADRNREFVEIAFTADGKTLVTLDRANGLLDDAETLSHWNPRTGERLRRKSFRVPSGLKDVLGISLDGKYLIMKEATDGIKLGDFGVAWYDYYLWNPLTDQRLTLKQKDRYTDFACMALSADGKLWAIGDRVERYYVQHPGAAKAVQERVGGTLQLWDTATGKKLRAIGPANGYSALAFSSEGKLLAGAVAEDHVICVWNVSDGKERCRFDSGPGEVKSLAFSHSGAVLLSGQPDNTVLAWRVGAASTD
jgi:WD40 repeat protein